MDQMELSLGGSSLSLLSESTTNSSPARSEANPRRKRKQTWDDPTIHTSIDLQLNDPLPLDWEQCLDLQVITSLSLSLSLASATTTVLQSGRIYFLNRKTLRKSWSRPKEQKLDLELNIATFASSEKKTASASPEKPSKSSSSGNMVAAVCVNCHLLVMLCKSSPSCPNCKHNSLPPPAQQPMPGKLETVKSLETLSLLH
ncbi:hypothetical protein B296_00018704 [Ensete ventricosum]|uniref:WW domain-containing protein n=1 Tax=Ensete ventricosum TaxID=4639 RepID=A0A426ZPE5_ENSVE|nr:hypothetical protein B296_00018704 [Ensete ventricosum]